MKKTGSKSIKVVKESAARELHECNSEKLSDYFVSRQIDDYCVSTQGVMPN